MRLRIFVLVTACLTATGMAQWIYPKKDLAFAQVAVGETIETVITLTNRGTFTYEGILFFRRGEVSTETGNLESLLWDPTVNGQPVTDGKFPIKLDPGETATFRITGTSLAVGTAILYANDVVLDNFIEGNLTYFITASPTITDSVGILPSTEFYLGSIPFGEFSATALALVNGDAEFNPTDGTLVERNDAQVRLNLFGTDGNLVSTQDLVLPPLTHTAKFLPELFPGIQLVQGKVEISSRRVGAFAPPIFGTAITLKANQFSSLPLEPSPVAYTIEMVSDVSDSVEPDVLTGELTLWAEGYFVKGYLRITMVNGEEILELPMFVSGELIDGILELSFYARSRAFDLGGSVEREVTLLIEDFDFDFEKGTTTGGWIILFLDPISTLTGGHTLTRITF